MFLWHAILVPHPFAPPHSRCYRWASVFPLSIAATAAVSFAHFKGETFWWVLATAMVTVATVATVLVAALTVRAVAQGTLPASPESLSLYWKVWREEGGAGGGGVTARGGGCEVGGGVQGGSVPFCQPYRPASDQLRAAAAPYTGDPRCASVD